MSNRKIVIMVSLLFAIGSTALLLFWRLPVADHTDTAFHETVRSEDSSESVVGIFQPMVQQMEPVISYITDIFLNENNDVDREFPIIAIERPLTTPSPYLPIQNSPGIVENTTPAASFFDVFEDTKQKYGIIRPLQRGDPYYATLWPDYYIDYLFNMQALVSAEGGTLSRTYSFESEEEIFLFFDEFLTFLHDRNILTAGDAARLRDSLHFDFPQSQTVDLRALQKKGAAENIIRLFSRVFSIPITSAQFGGDCYQDPLPGRLVKGYNVLAPCCDCTTCDIGLPPVQPPDNPPPPDVCSQTNRPLFCACSDNALCESGNCVQGSCLPACTSPDCLEIPPVELPPDPCSPEDPSCLIIPPVITLRDKVLKYFSGIIQNIASWRTAQRVQAQECIPLGCLNAVCPGANAIWDPATGICGCDL